VAGRRSRFLREIVRRVWKFVALFAGVYISAAVLFYLLQPNETLGSSFYWAITTLSTVGYGDIVPTTSYARAMTTVLLFGQIFLGGYLISVITSTVISESQKEALGTLGTDLRGHIVVLGYSAVGRSAVRELLIQEQPIAVVTETAEEVANVKALRAANSLYVTYGPAAEIDILRRANVPLAHAVIVCTTDDATNMIAALNARQLAPAARIVVSVSRPELRDTLRAAGVTYVASPSDMGGRLCASAAFETDVAAAMEDISAADVQSDMQEYLLTSRTPISAQTMEEAEHLARQASGALVIGFARPQPGGDYVTTLNPPGSTRLAPGDAVIVLGQIPNLRKFRQWFGTDQGR
jgi:Trk K+ transport system NAD-binding subunit